MKRPIICAHCGKVGHKNSGAINRSAKISAPLYCDKTCAGLGRRTNKSVEQKKEEKRLYDMDYRAKNLELITKKKAAYFQSTYDPAKAATERKKRMPYHVEYCRRPEYRQWKKKYDEQYVAKKEYGEFYESFLLLKKIDEEVIGRISKQEIRAINGTLNKSQTRRRDYERTYSNQP